MKNEEWREHKSGLLVSNLGRVFVPRSGRREEHYTIGCIDQDGHLKVTYKRKPYRVHKIVYRSFYPDTPKNYVIHHINGIGTDNRLENLIAVSVKEHSYIHNNEMDRKEKLSNIFINRKDQSKPVGQYDLNDNLIKIYPSLSEIKRQLGYRQADISSAIRNNHLSHGYIWKYK